MKNMINKALLSKRLAFTTIILALVFACTTQNNPEPQSVKIESNVPASIVSVDDAIKIAESFDGMENDKSENSKNLREKGDKPKKVKETKVLKSEKGVPHVYILNYEDAGFMVMSADERFIPVLAYVENGKNYSDESRKQIENDLQSNRPVILFAQDPANPVAHVWITDGIYVYHQTCPQAEIYYLNMNWGWYGDQNGWYFSTFWNPAYGNYTVNQFALVNINKAW
jgi:hypothetical protein